MELDNYTRDAKQLMLRILIANEVMPLLLDCDTCGIITDQYVIKQYMDGLIVLCSQCFHIDDELDKLSGPSWGFKCG